MINRRVFFISIVATSLATILLYKPVTLALYRLREPYYKCPVKVYAQKVPIRNDSWGDGEFGAKRRNGHTHSGIDIEAMVGTEVFASKSGIAFCGNVPTGYGKYVMIYHPDGSQTMYAHLSNQCVSSPKTVRQGELIGYAGNTGNAAHRGIKPHIHFEIRKDGVPQDPAGLMK